MSRRQERQHAIGKRGFALDDMEFALERALTARHRKSTSPQHRETPKTPRRDAPDLAAQAPVVAPLRPGKSLFAKTLRLER